ncbi:hypothetical protein HYT02_04670 [Candidatus Gottesmanbacteria bacterium]|nr:hypothetical protein [Candidatus Gottesmanbacteria bacterium]
MKKNLSLIFFLLPIVLFTDNVFAQTAVVINQIRGLEQCCQPGNMDLVNAVYNDRDIRNLAVGWAVRYDALSNKQITNSLKGEIGGLLEITPDFAKESGVEYKADEMGNDWHLGKNVFLIGYTQEEKKKLIDTYFNKFKNVFGYYPSFTVSWMIDSWSLNYLSEKYGVKLHEITKEQYQTDTYTLYGGIFNNPYYPSKTNPIIPSKTNSPIIIIRQTISDPIYNYGSPEAYYTSQPNDYLSDDIEKKDFSYFKKLVDNISSQKSGFPLAVLGFENSYDFDKYSTEYINQLKYLNEINTNILSPSAMVAKFRSDFKKNEPFTINALDEKSNINVRWYFSPSYRVRVLTKDGKTIITDLRNYASIDDPYTKNPADIDNSYYIAPYLIDSSQVSTDSIGIVIGKEEFIKFKPTDIVITDHSAYFHFSKDYFLEDLFELNDELSITLENNFDFVFSPEGDHIKLGYKNGIKYIFLFKLYKSGSEYKLQPVNYLDLNGFEVMFQPDRSDLPLDPGKSTFYWNNISATVNRNPIRLFINLQNKLSRPARAKSFSIEFSKNEGINVSYPSDFDSKITSWFVDISSSRPLSTNVSVLVDGVEVDKQKIFFLPNCKADPISCLTSLQDVIQYVSYNLSQVPAKLFPAPQRYEKDY